MNQELLDYLEKEKPYLYEIEKEVEKVRQKTGFGTVSVSLEISKRVVFKSNVFSNIAKIYQHVGQIGR